MLDPETTFTLPVRQISNGIVDAFTHVLEQYLTYPVNAPLQDRFAESILLTLKEEGPKAIQNPKDYDTMANFMWCATMALNGVIRTGVPTDWATHYIAHELTALHGIDHARTLAIVYPSLLRVKSDTKKKRCYSMEAACGALMLVQKMSVWKRQYRLLFPSLSHWT
ncbi:hypothetical protein GCM10028895_10720 [Pontibacter rugosus]